MGEGTPTKMAKGWIIFIVLTVPFVSMVLVFLLCCCRVHYFDHFRPISKLRAKRKAEEIEEMEKKSGFFVVGDVRRQQSMGAMDINEEDESLGQRRRRLREMGSGPGTEMDFDGHYSTTVHLSPGYRSPRTPSVMRSMNGIGEHYPSMVPELPLSTMASVNGMVAGSSYSPSVASTSVCPLGTEGNYHAVSQLGSIYSPDNRSIHGIMSGPPPHPAVSRENFRNVSPYPSYASFRDNSPPSVSSLQRYSYFSLENLRPTSQPASVNDIPASQPTHSPTFRQTLSRRKSLLSMQEYTSSSRENPQTVSERPTSIDGLSGPVDRTVVDSSDTHELPLSASQLGSVDMTKDSSNHAEKVEENDDQDSGVQPL